MQKALLWCGVLSSLLYAGINVYVAMQWREYSSVSQTVSELSAIGAPTRSLWVALCVGYELLTIAFGWGVWMSAGLDRRLHVVGALILAYGLVCVVWPLAPMHLRGDEFSLTDTMHIALASVTVVLMFAAIGLGVGVFGKRFRIYSIATIATLVVFGTLTAFDSPTIAANLPTPWIGAWERINIGAFLLWVAVLAIALERRVSSRSAVRSDRSRRPPPRYSAARASIPAAPEAR